MPQPKRVEVDVQGRTLSLSNLDKVLYPAAGFTKGHVIDYYTRVAPAVLPHLRGARADAQALPERRRRAVLLREERAEPPPGLGPDRDDPDPHGRAHDRLRARRRPADARVAGQPRRPRAAHLAGEGRRPAGADDPRLRPRPGRRRPRSSSAPRVALRLREVFAHLGLRGLPEDLGLEGDAGLRPAQRARHDLRADQALRAGDRAAAGAPPPRARGLRDAQGPARGQGVRRLEPERRAQDDRRRLLAARAGSSRPSRRRCAGRRSRRSTESGDPDELVFTSADVLERVAEHGDLFAPVETLEQELPAL